MKTETVTLTLRNDRQPVLARWLLATLLAGVIAQWDASADELSAGCYFDHFRLTLEDGERTEAAGPFYYSQRSASNVVWAVPPFYSQRRDPVVESQEEDVLYPLFTKIQYGHERRWQFFQLLNTSSGLNPDDTEPKQFTLFPFYFQQRAADTNLNYTAVLPFYGHLQNRLFRNEIYFVMFPGYIQTRKRDLVTDNYMFPIVDVHHGDGRQGWQVWPFVGKDHKVVTTQTNGYGEVTVVPGHDWSFYMWPFFLRQDNGLGTASPETFRASVPFYVGSHSPQHDATSVLWPMFGTIDDRARKYHEWDGPWPFVVFGRGASNDTSRVWPVFSESHSDTKENDSYAWPLYTYTRTHSDPVDQRRTRVAYILYSRLSLKNTDTGKERVRVDMWPFFTWHRDFNGNERLQVLAPLEPAVPDNPGIERNWSPLWSFWRAEDNVQTGARSRSLLWNLYRSDSTRTHRKVSCCFGLYQHEAGTNGESVRWFYLFGGQGRKK